MHKADGDESQNLEAVIPAKCDLPNGVNTYEMNTFFVSQ